MDEPDGIIVLGVPRSGTTLVRRILTAHPAIHCPPETNLLNACSRFLREEPFAGGLSVGVVSGLGFSGVREDEVIGALRALAFGFMKQLAAGHGKRRWAEKTAFDVFHLDAIERLCATECRFICVVRHGLDVVCSIKELCDRMDRYLPELHDYVERYPRPSEAFAWAWRDANERLQRFMDAHPDRCTLVRYEELVREPSRVLSELFRFLDEPADVPALLAGLGAEGDHPGLGDWKTYQRHGIDGSSINRWTTFDPETIGTLASIVNPILQQYGYPAVPDDNGRTVGLDSRRYQLGLLAAGMRAGGTS